VRGGEAQDKGEIFLLLKSEIRISKPETNSNVQNPNERNTDRFITFPFLNLLRGNGLLRG